MLPSLSMTHCPIQNLVPLDGPEDGSDDHNMASAIEKILYRDNSRVTPEEVEAEMQLKRKVLRKESTFPSKLHMLLSDPDVKDVITWLPHGRAWKILKQEKFETTVLPRYFEHGNVATFMRQVNAWGFKRIAKGVDANAYYHELFLQGMPYLCDKMSRSKSTKRDGASCPMKLIPITPDFYRISQEHPLPDETDRVISASPISLNNAQDNVYDSDTSDGMSQQIPPSREQSTNFYPNDVQSAAPYSILASEAIGEYILHDFAAAQTTTPSLQAFQQRLQARNVLLNNLRNISNQSSHSSVSFPTSFGLGIRNPAIAADIALLLEII